MIRMTTKTVLTLLLALPALASADWQLDAAASSVSFVSIKNETIAESHHFKRLQGSISEAGEAHLDIALGSVDTGIEIRDQRMREMLFQVSDFPSAGITVQLDSAMLTDLAENTPQSLTLPLQLDVHGNSAVQNAILLVLRDSAGCLHVLTQQPVLVNAADFGLADGIEALRDVAGLGSIAMVVPVSVHLQYRPQN